MPELRVSRFVKNNFGGFACYDNSNIFNTTTAAAVTAGGVDKWIRLRDNIHLVGERRI